MTENGSLFKTTFDRDMGFGSEKAIGETRISSVRTASLAK
jgi:hypothetical protein